MKFHTKDRSCAHSIRGMEIDEMLPAVEDDPDTDDINALNDDSRTNGLKD